MTAVGRRHVALAAATVVTILGLVAGASVLTTAQAPAGPAFEVASVKPNTSGDGHVMMAFQPGGRFTATAVPLMLLIRNAYRMQDFQLIGVPEWARSERFDVAAKGPDGMGPDQFAPMVRALLADRFKLVSHVETRELPMYALVLARNDSRLGPKMKTAAVDCGGLDGGGRRSPVPAGGAIGSMPPGGVARGGAVAGSRGSEAGMPPCQTRMIPGNIAGNGVPMSQLATTLSGMVGRPVQDKTGLSGGFDIELSWTPDGGRGLPPDGVAGLPPADTSGTSIFTAIQEQLGLKLESTRGPVEVLVIDHVDHPSPD